MISNSLASWGENIRKELTKDLGSGIDMSGNCDRHIQFVSSDSLNKVHPADGDQYLIDEYQGGKFGTYSGCQLVDKAWHALSKNDLNLSLELTDKLLEIHEKTGLNHREQYLEYGEPEEGYYSYRNLINAVAMAWYIQGKILMTKANQENDSTEHYSAACESFAKIVEAIPEAQAFDYETQTMVNLSEKAEIMLNTCRGDSK